MSHLGWPWDGMPGRGRAQEWGRPAGPGADAEAPRHQRGRPHTRQAPLAAHRAGAVCERLLEDPHHGQYVGQGKDQEQDDGEHHGAALVVVPHRLAPQDLRGVYT